MERKSRFESVGRITQITSSISIIIGIVVALVGLYDAKQQADLSFTAMRMTQLEPLREMIKKERENENALIEPFMKKLELCDNAKAAKRENSTAGCENDFPECKGLLTKEGRLPPVADLLEHFGGKGSEIYGHPCFDQFKQIGRHFDELGAMVRLGYVDFDFLFTLIPFPDDFWNDTLEYRGAIQTNWDGEGEPLDDFWVNFAWLHDRYQRERRARR
jgi:hypothetical protein